MKKLQLFTVGLIIGLIASVKCDSSCPANYCQNKGTCRINPLTKLPECFCKIDFAGLQCNQRRMSVIQLKLRSSLSFSLLRNCRHSDFYKTDGLFKTFIMETLNQTFSKYFNDYNFYYYVTIMGYQAGSIIAYTSANVAWVCPNATKASPPPVILPTRNQILSAMQTICTGPTPSASCSALQIDLPQSNNVTVNPNVCLVSGLNTCSPNAICTSTSNIAYTCTCKPGYRDDSGSNKPGTNCTEVCYHDKCGGSGTCHEKDSDNCECRCHFTRAGKHCKRLSRAGIAIVVVFALVVPILIVAIVVPVAIICYKRKNKLTNSKVDILQNEFIDSDVYSVADFDPKFFPEKELYFDPGALPEKQPI